ncbi:hypothetical protein H1P_1300004 [Hyella patelloides LEGE 07179]|uniref:Uncharacterized protein n=1 Tax=Hyella patelloides LEGE 07179 TaxID=945734 RepID=A0A563VKR9_9CYAN|nr:hypothetical protein H1P_1300004 [Hyella patelloides LEGE 07179]
MSAGKAQNSIRVWELGQLHELESFVCKPIIGLFFLLYP